MAKKKAAAKKKAKQSNNSKPKLVAKKGPRQQSLPGLEDRAIAVLDDAALSYAEIRDQRMELTLQETQAKDKVSKLMHKRGKTKYQHGNILIELIPEGEKVKVRIKPEGEENESPAEEEISAAEEAEEPVGEEPEEAEEGPDFDEAGEESEPEEAEDETVA
jgi:hypothetical protein